VRHREALTAWDAHRHRQIQAALAAPEAPEAPEDLKAPSPETEEMETEMPETRNGAQGQAADLVPFPRSASTQLAQMNRSAMGVGICNVPISGTVCIRGHCFGWPLPKWKGKKQADSALKFFNYVGNSLCTTKEDPCFSMGLTVCMALKVGPADAFTMEMTLGAKQPKCNGIRAIMSTFHINFDVNLCTRWPAVGAALAAVGLRCASLAGLKYFPFIGLLTLSDSTEDPSGYAKIDFSLRYHIHDLTPAVSKYCEHRANGGAFGAMHGKMYDFGKRWSSHQQLCSWYQLAPQCRDQATKDKIIRKCISEFNDDRGDQRVKLEGRRWEVKWCWGWMPCGGKWVKMFDTYKWDL
jgi:hypothetical protein